MANPATFCGILITLRSYLIHFIIIVIVRLWPWRRVCPVRPVCSGNGHPESGMGRGAWGVGRGNGCYNLTNNSINANYNGLV